MIPDCLRTTSIFIAMTSAVIILAGPSEALPREPEIASNETNDWVAFRGPGGQGVSTAKALPVEWSESENIAWKIPMPGPGASSPIVFKDHIYISCYSGFFVPGESAGSQKDLKRHLLCLDRKSGKTLWEKGVAAKLPEENSIRDHGFAASTPAADEDHVYCFFGKTGVIAFSHDGKQLWDADVGSKTHGWGSSASPVTVLRPTVAKSSTRNEWIAPGRSMHRPCWLTAKSITSLAKVAPSLSRRRRSLRCLPQMISTIAAFLTAVSQLIGHACCCDLTSFCT